MDEPRDQSFIAHRAKDFSSLGIQGNLKIQGFCRPRGPESGLLRTLVQYFYQYLKVNL